MTHVNMYDTVPWCEAEDPWENGNECGGGAPSDPEDGDCTACLRAIVAYGYRASQRLARISDAVESRAAVEKEDRR